MPLIWIYNHCMDPTYDANTVCATLQYLLEIQELFIPNWFTLSMENNGYWEKLKYLNTLIFPEMLSTCDR